MSMESERPVTRRGRIVIPKLSGDIIRYLLTSFLTRIDDAVICRCVCKEWKEVMPLYRRISIPAEVFGKYDGNEITDAFILRVLSTIQRLEELSVYSRFTSKGVTSWLNVHGETLQKLELNVANVVTRNKVPNYGPFELKTLNGARNLKYLKLLGVRMAVSPNWEGFSRLEKLEIVHVRTNDTALSDALRACPNLTTLSILVCEGIHCLTIKIPTLQECRFDVSDNLYSSICVISPRLNLVDIRGCSSSVRISRLEED